MVLIINSKNLGISKSTMEELYRKNLILCDDYELIVAEIPSWAISEVESILGYKLNDYMLTKGYKTPSTKIDVMLYNSYHYPKLYNLICKNERS